MAKTQSTQRHPQKWFRSVSCAALLTLACLLCAAPAQAEFPQMESPVTCNEGFPFEPIAFLYGDHTVGCELNLIADMDTFEFEGDLGDSVRIIVAGQTRGADWRLQLRDPLGALILEQTCSASSTRVCRILGEIILPRTGTYSIKIGESGLDQTGFYTLQLERLFPFPAAPCVARDSTDSDTITPLSDVDFVIFGGLAGTEVQTSIAGRTRGADWRLEVWDPDGLLIANKTCAASSTRVCSITWPEPGEQLPKTGRYLVAFSESGSDGTGNYDLNLQCVFGYCPPNCIPPSCPNGDVETGNDLMPSGMVTGDIIFEALESIATDDSNFIVTPSGCASMFAGGQVELKPGTKVDPGGVLQVVVE